MRCTRCGGYSIDLLENASARCRTCGLEVAPTLLSLRRRLRQALKNVIAVVIGIVLLEGAIGVLFGMATQSIRSAVGGLWLYTGIGALLIAGIYAGGTKVGPGVWVSNPNSIPNRNANLIGWLTVCGASLLGLGLLVEFVLP